MGLVLSGVLLSATRQDVSVGEEDVQRDVKGEQVM
jgi:hypothetical protein